MAAGRKSATVAFFLSILPGLGHIYAGAFGSGVVWLAVCVALYNSPIAPVALVAHLVCASAAAGAAGRSNAADARELAARRESAREVAASLDRTLDARGGGRIVSGPDRQATAPPGAPAPDDPPPRLLRAAYPVPPERLFAALEAGIRRAGLVDIRTDAPRGRLLGQDSAGGGAAVPFVAHVEATPAGSRVRMILDRPPGARRDEAADDARLRALLQLAEQALGADAVPAPGPAKARGADATLTEDVFLERLRDGWLEHKAGALDDDAWRERKARLIRGVVLRAGTRPADLTTACRPLVEAGVLDAADLRALENALRD